MEAFRQCKSCRHLWTLSQLLIISQRGLAIEHSRFTCRGSNIDCMSSQQLKTAVMLCYVYHAMLDYAILCHVTLHYVMVKLHPWIIFYYWPIMQSEFLVPAVLAMKVMNMFLSNLVSIFYINNDIVEFLNLPKGRTMRSGSRSKNMIRSM